jgi:hypothetical protein
MAEEGYDNELGYKALDRVIQRFWFTVDVDTARKRDSTVFQFSEALKKEFKAIKVRSPQQDQFSSNRSRGVSLAEENFKRSMARQFGETRLVETLIEKASTIEAKRYPALKVAGSDAAEEGVLVADLHQGAAAGAESGRRGSGRRSSRRSCWASAA